MAKLDVLFLVPARAGSKRFPEKNKAVFNGEMLWVHAYNQCVMAQHMLKGIESMIVVSTDDDEISFSETRFSAGLERPPELCTDDATSESVALHALEHYPADMVCLVQPTSPLRRPLDIVRCVMACQAATFEASMRSINGAVYTMWSQSLRQGVKFGTQLDQLITMPAERSIDIDTEADLEKARAYLADS